MENRKGAHMESQQKKRQERDLHPAKYGLREQDREMHLF